MANPLTIFNASVQPQSLAWQVAAATVSRVVINTARRFVYTFAPVLSRAMGLPLTAITSLIAINQAAGLLSPIFGSLSDRLGYRMMMLAGVSLLTIGMFLGGLFPFYGMIVISLIMAGLCKSLFDPALHAYIGEQVPFAQRGRVIGIIEFGWAGSVLIGIPTVGILIDRWGWRAPFFVIGGLALLCLVAIRILMPARSAIGPANRQPPLLKGWQLLRRNRAAVGALGFGLLLSLANDILFVIYGAWLEADFSLKVVALGMATTVIGLAELLGEILTASIADRLGPKRAIGSGIVLTAFSYALLPLLAKQLPLALLGIFLIFLFFEFTVVTSLSLFTELLPQARATMMSVSVATSSLGRMAGAAIGGLVWQVGGLTAVCMVASIVTGLALVSLLWGLRHWQPSQQAANPQ